MNIKYPHVTVQLTGIDGNAFSIMGAVKQGLRKGNVPAEEIKAVMDEMMSGDYDHLLVTAMQMVEVI